MRGIQSIAFLAGGLFLGCASHTKLLAEDQQTIQSTYRSKAVYLKQSFFVGPFYAYDDRYYISERAFDERILIETPAGVPILPCDPIGLLPLGTRLKVRDIEFPTSFEISKRMLRSPRHFTWVLLEADGQPKQKPYVLVMTQEFKTLSEVRTALDAYLGADDPRPALRLSADDQGAIDRKTVVKGMSAAALLRSRGQPDKITRRYAEGVKTEQWQYSSQRLVVLKEDKIDSWQGFPALALETFKPSVQ